MQMALGCFQPLLESCSPILETCWNILCYAQTHKILLDTQFLLCNLDLEHYKKLFNFILLSEQSCLTDSLRVSLDLKDYNCIFVIRRLCACVSSPKHFAYQLQIAVQFQLF